MKGNHMLSKSDVHVGDTVRVVPLGLLVEVRYNDRGVISGIYLLSSEGKPTYKLDTPVSTKLQKTGVVPSRLVQAHSCNVQGVVTVLERPFSSFVSEGVKSTFLDLVLTRSTSDFTFYAYNLESSSVTYGAYQQVTALEMMGFKTCASFVLSSDYRKNKFNTLPAMRAYPFVSAYMVLEHGSNSKFIHSNISFNKVTKVNRDVNYSGYIVAEVLFEDGTGVSVPYPEIVRYNVQKGSYCVVDDGNIVYCTAMKSGSKKVESEFHCKYCGTLIKSPLTGYVKCPYQNCVSNMYPVVENMLRQLNLEPMSYSRYKQLIDNGDIQHLVDVFLLEPYRTSHVLCTPSSVLRAVCPPTVVKDRNFFDRLVEGSGSLDALFHYLEKPDEIYKDMKDSVSYMTCKSFEQWVSDPENLLTVNTFFNLENIEVVEHEIDLKVDKIFRNKVIYLEGDFRHGSYSRVSSILKSYGASIASKFDNRCDCVILGDFVRDVTTVPVVDIALSYNVPVYREKDFFQSYLIDKDIEDQLY